MFILAKEKQAAYLELSLALSHHRILEQGVLAFNIYQRR
jgi:hypothetical protein